MLKALFRNAGLLSLVAVFIFITFGCNDSSWVEKHTDAVDARQIESEKEPVERKKLVFWHIQLSGSISEVVKNSVERFKKENPDVDVEFVPYLNEPYKVKLVVAMGTRNPPDVFSTWGGGPLCEYVKAAQVLDITAMMERDDYKNRFLDNAIQNVAFDGKIWGVPVEGCAIAVIFYNKKMFEEHGLAVPATYGELVDIVKKLRSKGIIPFALANRTKWPGSIFYMYLVDRLGGPGVFDSAANRKGGSFEDEVFIKAGEMLQQLVKLDAFPEGFNGLDYDTIQSRSLMYADKAAMELMGSWYISYVIDEDNEFYKNDLDFFPFPAIEGGEGNPLNLVGTIGDNYYSISKSCKYPEEAFKLIQYLIDDKAISERIAIGRIPPVKNLKVEEIRDPMSRKVLKLIDEAPSVQLWYDQYLPPELGEKHKETCQALFDLSISPQEAAGKMEEAAKNYFKSAK